MRILYGIYYLLQVVILLILLKIVFSKSKLFLKVVLFFEF